MLGLYLHSRSVRLSAITAISTAVCSTLASRRGMSVPSRGNPPGRSREKSTPSISVAARRRSSSRPVGRLIHACRQAFRVEQGAEITLETNPETSSVQRMDGFREAGVNRVSFGVQSFRDAELKRLGRLHSADRAVAAAGEARTAGFGNISLDLMWLPGSR